MLNCYKTVTISLDVPILLSPPILLARPNNEAPAEEDFHRNVGEV